MKFQHHPASIIFTDKYINRSDLEEEIYQYWRNHDGEINWWDEDDADDYPLISKYIEDNLSTEDDILITYYN